MEVFGLLSVLADLSVKQVPLDLWEHQLEQPEKLVQPVYRDPMDLRVRSEKRVLLV